MGTSTAGPGTFATAFDEALSASGTTVSALRSRLAERGHKVASSTLGYWRSGQRQPERAESLEAVGEIEAILRLRPGTLTNAIGASRRPGPPIPRAAVDDLPSMSPGVSEALGLLDMEMLLPGHIEEAVDITADIDASGHWERMSTRSRLRATADDVSRSTAFCLGRPGSTPTEVIVGTGARLGRTVRLDEEGVLVAELFLERPLSLGETAIVEYTFSFVGEDDAEFGTYATNRLSDVSVWARFAPERTPSRGWRFTQAPGADEVVVEVDLTRSTSIHHAQRGFGPGLMGVRWEW